MAPLSQDQEPPGNPARVNPATGELANPRRAYGCIRQLRIIVIFDVETKHRACMDLREALSAQRLKQGGRRKQAMAREHVDLALALAIQFSCALRQKDVIGEWSADPQGGMRWAWGLLWGEHVRADWTLAKPTSKSNGEEVAKFDLKLLPLAMAELQRTPPEARIGPMVRCEGTGRPWKQRLFAQRFREVARAAGIPDNVWNMDSRAGAITEAYDKRARGRRMDLGTHQERETSQRYNRGRMTKTSRVSTLRFGPKNKG